MARLKFPSVAISGLPFFVSEFFHTRNESITGWRHHILRFGNRLKLVIALFQLAFSDVWYTIGAPETDRYLGAVIRFLRKPRVMHWVGSDVDSARENPSIILKLEAQKVLHLAEVEWTARELEELGLHARIVPLPPRLMTRPLTAMPEVFTLLLYLPRSRAAFYGREEYERLIKNLRDEKMRFLIVGGGTITTEFSAPVENLGHQVSMDEVYANSSALLRFPKRDGLSLMVLEALLLGRYVLWSHNFPFVTPVTDYASTEAAVRCLLGRHLEGALPLQTAASTFVAERYDYQRCLMDIADAWNESLRKKLSSS